MIARQYQCGARLSEREGCDWLYHDGKFMNSTRFGYSSEGCRRREVEIMTGGLCCLRHRWRGERESRRGLLIEETLGEFNLERSGRNKRLVNVVEGYFG